MNNTSAELPEYLDIFIDSVTWTFAKTMPRWSYEYIVRKKVDEKFFLDMVQYIRSSGYEGYFIS